MILAFRKLSGMLLLSTSGREDLFSLVLRERTGEESVPQRPGEMFGVNDENEMLFSRVIPRISVPPEIPFCQGIEKVQIGISLDADYLPAYLKGAVRVVWVHNGKREARITFEIAELLARFGLAETDVFPIPIEPDRGVVWFPLWSDGGNLCQGGSVQQISVFL